MPAELLRADGPVVLSHPGRVGRLWSAVVDVADQRPHACTDADPRDDGHAARARGRRQEHDCYQSGIVSLMALTLRTDEELEQALAALAESEGLSRQEVIRRAVLERYERAGHRARVEASADKLIDRWGDVLDRLGSV